MKFYECVLVSLVVEFFSRVGGSYLEDVGSFDLVICDSWLFGDGGCDWWGKVLISCFLISKIIYMLYKCCN